MLDECRRALILDEYALRIRRSLNNSDSDNAEHLARSMTSMAGDMRGIGAAERALALGEEVLVMRRALRRCGQLPNDRDEARTLDNLSQDLRLLGWKTRRSPEASPGRTPAQPRHARR